MPVNVQALIDDDLLDIDVVLSCAEWEHLETFAGDAIYMIGIEKATDYGIIGYRCYVNKQLNDGYARVNTSEIVLTKKEATDICRKHWDNINR